MKLNNWNNSCIQPLREKTLWSECTSLHITTWDIDYKISCWENTEKQNNHLCVVRITSTQTKGGCGLLKASKIAACKGHCWLKKFDPLHLYLNNNTEYRFYWLYHCTSCRHIVIYLPNVSLACHRLQSQLESHAQLLAAREEQCEQLKRQLQELSDKYNACPKPEIMDM